MAEEQTKSTKEKDLIYLSLQRKAVAIYSIVGALIGYVSFTLNQPLQSLGLAIAVFALLTIALGKLWKPEEKLGEKRKWWGTSAVAYFGLWLVIWTIFFNITLVKGI